MRLINEHTQNSPVKSLSSHIPLERTLEGTLDHNMPSMSGFMGRHDIFLSRDTLPWSHTVPCRPNFCHSDWTFPEVPISNTLREMIVGSRGTITPAGTLYQAPEASFTQPDLQTPEKIPDVSYTLLSDSESPTAPTSSGISLSGSSPITTSGPTEHIQSIQRKQKKAAPPVRKQAFECGSAGCSKSFKRREHLKRHMSSHTKEKPHICWVAQCRRSFSRVDNLNAHYKNAHSKKESRNRYVATLDENSPYYDPLFRGELTSDGRPLYTRTGRQMGLPTVVAKSDV